MTNDTTNDLLPRVIKRLRQILKPGEKHRADEVERIWKESAALNPRGAWAVACNAFGFAEQESEVDAASAAAAIGRSTPAFDRWMRATTPGHKSYNRALKIGTLKPIRTERTGYGRYDRPFYRLSQVRVWGEQIRAHEREQAARDGVKVKGKAGSRPAPTRLETIADANTVRFSVWTYERAVVSVLVGEPDFTALAFAHQLGPQMVVESLTLREALTEREWLDAEERAVWLEAFEDLLKRETKALARGNELQERRDVRGLVQGGVDSGRSEELPAGKRREQI